MEWVWILIGVVVIGSIMLGISSNNDRNDRIYKVVKMLGMSAEEVDANENINLYVSANQANVLHIDYDTKELKFITTSNNEEVLDKVEFQDIIKAELIVDGESVTTTSRGSQIGGAAIGGLLLGGAGAIIGGLSGKTKHSKEIENIYIKILVNDNNKPTRNVVFLDLKLNKDNPILKKALEKAGLFTSKLDVILHGQKAQINDTNQDFSETTNKTLSVADEIKKLVELKNQGILSDEEFQNAKVKLLSN